jgi:hypothetical protein
MACSDSKDRSIMADDAQGAAVLPARQYNHQVAVAGFAPTAGDISTESRPHGYVFDNASVSGALTDEAGGAHLFFFGTSAKEVARPPMLMSRGAGGSFSLQPRAADGVYTGPCTVVNDAGGTRFEGGSGSAGEPGFVLAAGPDHLEAHHGAFDLHGDHALALNLMIPELDLYHPLLEFAPGGSIGGVAVTGGLLTYGSTFLSDGRTMMNVEMAGYTSWEDVWCMGVNVYDTGEREWIHLMKGKEGYGFVLAISAGPDGAAVVTAKSMEPKLEIDGDIDDDTGALRFVYRTSDGDWEGTVAAEDRVVGVPVFSWANVQRVGERRTG